MAGLLDFALGFGQGAAAGVASTAQQRIKSRAEEVRMNNLARLRAQYRRDNLDYEYKKRGELAELEASLEPDETPEAPSAQSTLGKELVDAGYPYGSPEYVAEARRRIAADDNRSSRTGTDRTVVMPDGNFKPMDSSEPLPEGAAYLVESTRRTDRISDNEYIDDSQGRTYIQTARGYERVFDEETGQETQTGGPRQETANRQESEGSDRPEMPMMGGAIFDPGAAVGPVDTTLRALSSLPGVASVLGIDSVERIRADTINTMLDRDLLKASAINAENGGRLSNMDITLTREELPTASLWRTNEQAYFTKLDQYSDMLSYEAQQIRERVSGNREGNTMTAKQEADANAYANSIESATKKIEMLLDARTLSQVEINGTPVGALSNSMLEDMSANGLTIDQLSPTQKRALAIRSRYLRGR